MAVHSDKTDGKPNRSVQEEAFRLHPQALWYVGKAIAVVYLASAVLMILGGGFLYGGAILCLLGLSSCLPLYEPRFSANANPSP